MSTEVTFEEKGLELCLLMEEGRNQARNHFFFYSSVDGTGIAKYCLPPLMFTEMKMKVPFVSRTVGMICFISSLTLFVL